MKTWIKTSIAAAVAATVGLGATGVMAGGWGGCDGGRMGKAGWGQKMAPEQMKQRMEQRADLHLARLELALALTPEQKPAWDTFKGAMKQRVENMSTHMQARRTAAAPATAVERLQRMEEMSRLRQAQLAETRKAVEAFYPALSDAQKTVFDAEFQRMGRKGGHRMAPGGGGGAGTGPRG